MRRVLGAAGALLLILTGCATVQSTTVQSTTASGAPAVPGLPNPTVTITHGARHTGIDIEQPPPFHIRYGDTELHLNPTTYCYIGGCVDGVDPNPPDVGPVDELFVFVPIFTELLVRQVAGGDCPGRRVDAELTPLGDGWWSVRPRGPADEYLLHLLARGDRGDMAAELRWTTPHDRPLPKPSARLALIANHDGRPDSYGLELEVTNLPATPTQYRATITVTASNGRSLTFEASESGEICVGEGTIYFDEPDAEAKQAAQLGDFPFTMTVELTLDGVMYVGTATYPDDEIPGNEPSVALTFDRPLPR